MLRADGALPPPPPAFDFAYIDVLLAIELLGWDHHNDPLKAAEDAARRRALVALGGTVLEFTWDEVWRHPELVVAEILSHLDRLRMLAS